MKKQGGHLTPEEIQKKMKAKGPNFYIDNEELHEEIKRYQEFGKKWIEENPDKLVPGCKKPVPPLEGFPKIGKAIYELATRLVNKRCWKEGILNKEDMVSEITFDIIKYLMRYDETRGTPFSFMTMIGESSLRRFYNKKLNNDEKTRIYFEKVTHDMGLELASEGCYSDPFKIVKSGFNDGNEEDI